MPVTGALDATFSLRARIKGTAGTGPNPTVDQRLSAAEQNIKLIDTRIDQVENEIDQRFGEHADKLTREQQERASQNREIRDLLTATETGGLHISEMGVVWLVVGAILGAMAPDLERWLGPGG